jgi:serine/threonine-protein kinase
MELPSLFGPWRLEARLGVGGMAEVFRARAFGANGFEKLVVIKTLRPELIGEARFERMFLEEAKLQARLSHRNLVGAHDLGVTDGRPWVLLELVDGLDLGSLRLPLPSPIAARIVGEVALGLIALHEATDEAGRPLGIVHRDVSAKNVLLSRWGEVKLADFGIARATQLKEDTRANARKGTWAYMSPEQVSGRVLSAASDQFALATLAVELFTGRRPFDGPTPLETMDRIREALVPPLDDLPPALRPAMLRAFHREPAARHPSMRDLRRALLEAGPSADELEVAEQVRASLKGEPSSASAPKTAVDTQHG